MHGAGVVARLVALSLFVYILPRFTTLAFVCLFFVFFFFFSIIGGKENGLLCISTCNILIYE